MNAIVTKENINIENMIYEIRSMQVMLDSDLAKLYECKNGTKEINQAVKNNPDKFPKRFAWVLTDDELNNLRSKFLTANYGKMSRVNPRVFTEQGVAMLATILKSKIATEISIKTMDAFVNMRKYISTSLIEQKYINNLVLEDHNLIKENSENIKLLQESFDKLQSKKENNEIYFNGQIFDAYFKIYEIFSMTKNKLIIIDNYADNTILDIIKRLNINVIIITKSNNLLTKQDIDKYNKQYHNLNVYFDNTFHDRYFILDNTTLYHCGASINRIGYKTFSINLISDIKIKNTLIKEINKITK